jgi:phenylacetic acid degradation protein
MGIFEFEGRKPYVPESCYVDPTATIVGMVELGENCFIGPGARIKGDYGHIVLGEGSNVQENCVIHARPGCRTELGEGVTVGHGAILHGPSIGNYTVIGMGAVVPDDVQIGEFCIVAEGTVLTNGTEVPPRSIVVGVPGKVRSELPAEKEGYCTMAADTYRGMASRYKQGLSALTREQAATRNR